MACESCNNNKSKGGSRSSAPSRAVSQMLPKMGGERAGSLSKIVKAAKPSRKK